MGECQDKLKWPCFKIWCQITTVSLVVALESARATWSGCHCQSPGLTRSRRCRISSEESRGCRFRSFRWGWAAPRPTRSQKNWSQKSRTPGQSRGPSSCCRRKIGEEPPHSSFHGGKALKEIVINIYVWRVFFECQWTFESSTKMKFDEW